MPQTVVVPKSLLRKMEKASKAFHEMEDELEDFLISRNASLLDKLSRARKERLLGDVKPFSQIQKARQ